MKWSLFYAYVIFANTQLGKQGTGQPLTHPFIPSILAPMENKFWDGLTLSHLQPCLYNPSWEPWLLTLRERTRSFKVATWVGPDVSHGLKTERDMIGITITFDKNLKTANGRADEQTLLEVRAIKKHVCKWQSYRRGDRAFGSDHPVIWCPKVFHLGESLYLSHHPHLQECLDLLPSSTQMYTQPYTLSLVSRVSPSVQTDSGPHWPTPQRLALRTILARPCSVLNDSDQSQ